MRVNCTLNLLSIVFEAKLLFYAYLYFSFKYPFISFSLKTISAKLVPINNQRFRNSLNTLLPYFSVLPYVLF